MADVYYRVHEYHDEDGRCTLSVATYAVARRTRCGVVLTIPWVGETWVKNGGRKRWAYPTRAKAIESFRRRKQSQISWGQYHIRRAEEALRNLGLLEGETHG